MLLIYRFIDVCAQRPQSIFHAIWIDSYSDVNYMFELYNGNFHMINRRCVAFLYQSPLTHIIYSKVPSISIEAGKSIAVHIER
jgi:hypothetical protein